MALSGSMDHHLAAARTAYVAALGALAKATSAANTGDCHQALDSYSVGVSQVGAFNTEVSNVIAYKGVRKVVKEGVTKAAKSLATLQQTAVGALWRRCSKRPSKPTSSPRGQRR